MVEAQYPQAPTSTAKKCTDQLFVFIVGQSGSYFPNLVAFHDSIFSSQGQVSSTIITIFVVAEYRRISDLSCEIAIAGGITSVDSRSDKRTLSGALFSHPQFFFLKFLVSTCHHLTFQPQKILPSSNFLIFWWNFPGCGRSKSSSVILMVTKDFF